jgi:hypothetical protein
MPPAPRFVVDRFALRVKIARLHAAFGKRRPPKGLDPEPLPVEPNRPSTLSGGAAAALEFDD